MPWGAGKTTIEQRYPDEVQVFHFDRTDVPSVDRMIADSGSREAWQRDTKFEWLARLAPLCGSWRAIQKLHRPGPNLNWRLRIR